MELQSITESRITIKVREAGLRATLFLNSLVSDCHAALCIYTIKWNIMQNRKGYRSYNSFSKRRADTVFDPCFLPSAMTRASLCQISSEEA